jgi:hypothetical protein
MNGQYIRKQLNAIDPAIDALKDIRRRRFAMGEVAYTQQGITDLQFAIRGHSGYEKYTKAIQELEDMKEILTDPGVKVEAEQGQLL